MRRNDFKRDPLRVAHEWRDGAFNCCAWMKKTSTNNLWEIISRTTRCEWEKRRCEEDYLSAAANGMHSHWRWFLDRCATPKTQIAAETEDSCKQTKASNSSKCAQQTGDFPREIPRSRVSFELSANYSQLRFFEQFPSFSFQINIFYFKFSEKFNFSNFNIHKFSTK